MDNIATTIVHSFHCHNHFLRETYSIFLHGTVWEGTSFCYSFSQDAYFEGPRYTIDAVVAHGAGLMGEQSAESTRALISKLETQYQAIVNPLDRL